MSNLTDESLNFNFDDLADSLQDSIVPEHKVEDNLVNDGFFDDSDDDFFDDDSEESTTLDANESPFSGVGSVENTVDDSFLDDELNKIFNQDSLVEEDSDDTEVDETIEQDDVPLEIVEDCDSYAEVIYPCLILNGANSIEEVEFLKTFSTDKFNSKAIYLYCEAKQGVCEVGYIKLDLQFLLTLSRMPGYTLFVVGSENSERNEINLLDANSLVKFISL